MVRLIGWEAKRVKLFSSDITALRQRLDKKSSELKKERQPHENKWREIRDYFEPECGRALDGISAGHTDADESAIVNSAPRLTAQRCASGMQGGITNPASQWFGLRAVNEDLAEQTDVMGYGQSCASRMASTMSQSNFYVVFHQMYHQSCLFGNTAALLVPDDELIARMIFCDVGSFWMAADKSGKVARLLRCFHFTVDQIVDEFSEAAIEGDSVLLNAKKNNSEEEFVVWHLVEPNDGTCKDVLKERTYSSFYWHDGSPRDCMLAIRSFDYNPIIAPRWYLMRGVYGFGCGHIVLNDNKELQGLEEDSLYGIAQGVKPALQAPSTMRDDIINLEPGGMTYVDPTEVGRGSGVRRLFDDKFNVEQVEMKARQMEQRIDKAFFVDLFAMLLNLSTQPREMTARQVNELSREKMSLLGPVLTRMNSDMLDPVVEGLYQIMLEARAFKELPESLQGESLTTEYISVLHTEQQAAMRLGGIIKFIDLVQMVAMVAPESVDKFDGDQALDEGGKALSVAASVVRSDREVDALRGRRAQAQQQQQQMMAEAEMMKSGPQALKTLSETDGGSGGNLLDSIRQGGFLG